jgi:hypothetical protein
MAVVAAGHVPVIAFHPSLEYLVHRVAVHARLRVRAQVGKSPGIDEGVRTKADKRAEKKSDNDSPLPVCQENAARERSHGSK